MAPIHETTRLSRLLDSVASGKIALESSRPGWNAEATARLLESIAAGLPIGMIAIAESFDRQWVADGRRRLHALLAATATTAAAAEPRFDLDLESHDARVRIRPTGEGRDGRWFPVESLRATEAFHQARNAARRGTDAESAEQRDTRAHTFAKTFHEYPVPVIRVIECDEATAERVRAGLNAHRER